MKQKLIALILVLCSVGALLVPQVMAEEKPVSRIEWCSSWSRPLT